VEQDKRGGECQNVTLAAEDSSKIKKSVQSTEQVWRVKEAKQR
jgi:hypothetical protein